MYYWKDFIINRLKERGSQFGLTESTVMLFLKESSTSHVDEKKSSTVSKKDLEGNSFDISGWVPSRF